MEIHPKDSRLLRLVLSIPLFIISAQALLYDFNEDYLFYKVLDIIVFLLSSLSYFGSVNKTIKISNTGIQIISSIHLVDNKPFFRILFVTIMIIYNPFIEFEFERVTWNFIDLSTALLFSIPMLVDKAKEKKIYDIQLKREYDERSNKK